MKSPTINPSDLRLVGSGLRRPEGVCVAPDGAVWATDANSLVARIDADGRVRRYGPGSPMPLGIAAQLDGRIIVAEYLTGDLIRVDPKSGSCESLVRSIDGRRITAPNYPAIDLDRRIWCSNSTDVSLDDPAKALTSDDGFLFVVEPDGSSRIVAEGLHYANGLAFAPQYDYLYVVESGTRRVSRAVVRPNGLVGPFEPFGPQFDAIPDGIAFDQAGNLWVTLLIEYDALVVIDPGGSPHTVIRDGILGAPTNIAFGGDDLRDMYIGSLKLEGVLHTRVEIPGVPLAAQFGGR